MDEIKDDLKAIRNDVSEIKTHVAVNTASLTAHMERTALNEHRVEKLEYVLIGLFAATVFGGVIKLLIS